MIVKEGIDGHEICHFQCLKETGQRKEKEILYLILDGKENLMKRFKVKLHGENILLDIDGEFKKFGFYATNIIKAQNPQEAKKIAAILIRRHPNLKDTVLNESTDPPTINIEEIEEVSFLKFFTKKSTTSFNFTFYPEDEE